MKMSSAINAIAISEEDFTLLLTIIDMCFDQVGIYIHALGNRRPGAEKDQGESFNVFSCITDKALLNQRH